MTILSPFALSQILVVIAFCVDFLAFQNKSRRNVLFFFIISALCMAAHFFLLERQTAGVLALLIAVRLLMARAFPSERWAYVFQVITCICAYCTWQGAVSGVALVGSLIGTWASFQHDDRLLRLWFMAASSAWLVHNVLIFSPAACVIELASIGSNLLGYWRFYRRSSSRRGS